MAGNVAQPTRLVLATTSIHLHSRVRICTFSSKQSNTAYKTTGVGPLPQPTSCLTIKLNDCDPNSVGWT